MFTINYQLRRSRNGTSSGRHHAHRGGAHGRFFAGLSRQGPVTIYDPLSGAPFPSNLIPANRINPAALALVNYYPLPNAPGFTRNYSAPITSLSNSDNINARVMNISVTKKDRLSGGLGYMGSNSTTPNLFGFIDTGTNRSINANTSWTHTLNTHLISSLRYTFSRSRNLSTPFFSDKTNVEGALGITGASTAPMNWGPPNLSFTSGINGLSDGAATLSRNQTSAVGESLIFVHNTHNFTFGGDFRRQQINPLSDANARGAFTFTGQTTSQIVNGVAAAGTGFRFRRLPAGAAGHQLLAVWQPRQVLPHQLVRRLHDRRLAHQHQVESQHGTSLGLHRAHHRVVQPHRQPGYRVRLHGHRAGLARPDR